MKKNGYVVVDAHCDTLSALEGQGIERTRGHFDLERMMEGGVDVQFFAVFVSPFYKGRELEKALELIDVFYAELENRQDIEPVTGWEQLKICLNKGRRAGILTVEGGEALLGNIKMLRVFYRLGVRSLALTWNNRNCLADGVGETKSGGGLSGFGVEVVKEMNRLGMVIDVSHLSERGFWDVLEVSRHPVIASHSNARSVCNHPRNLNDEQIKALAESGGVMGLNFVPAFVGNENSDLKGLLKHVDHVVELAGPEVLGIGSDFDGMEKIIEGIEDVSKMPALYKALEDRGFNREDRENILGKNFLRVLRKVIS